MDELLKFIMYGPGGNIASAVGVLIAIVGFGLTLRSVWKSKAAAMGAESAVKKIREDIRTIDTVSDLSSAISIMEEIKRLHREKAWPVLLDRYSSLKRLLIAIRGANPDFSDDFKTALQAAIQHINNIDKQVEIQSPRMVNNRAFRNSI